MSAHNEPARRLQLFDSGVNDYVNKPVLAQELIGEHGMVEPVSAKGRGKREPRGPNKWLDQIMGSLGNSIAGGASNIQRNIIAERGLGRPPTPAAVHHMYPDELAAAALGATASKPGRYNVVGTLVAILLLALASILLATPCRALQLDEALHHNLVRLTELPVGSTAAVVVRQLTEHVQGDVALIGRLKAAGVVPNARVLVQTGPDGDVTIVSKGRTPSIAFLMIGLAMLAAWAISTS